MKTEQQKLLKQKKNNNPIAVGMVPAGGLFLWDRNRESKIKKMSIIIIFFMLFSTQLFAEQYQWEKITVPYNIADSAVVVYQGDAYLVGGRTAMSHYAHCSDQIWKFDPQNSSWQQMNGILPYGMFTRNKVIVAGDKLIISPSEGPYLQGGYGSHQKLVEYDFISDFATETASYSNVRWAVNFGGFNVNTENRVYSFGGWGGASYQVHSYSLETQSLEVIETAQLSGARSVPLVGYDLSGKAYLFGGNSAPKLTVEIFDPVTEKITNLGNILPEEILGDDSFAWTSSTGEIYIAKSNPSGKIYKFDTSDYTFEEADFTLPAPTEGYELMFGAYDSVTKAIYILESKKWDGSNQFDSHLWMGIVPEPCSLSIDKILLFIDDSIANGKLQGNGSGKSAQGKLNALISMIWTAGDLIDANLLSDACGQLSAALAKTDGLEPPDSAPDFVDGEAVPVLANMIQELKISLGCN